MMYRYPDHALYLTYLLPWRMIHRTETALNRKEHMLPQPDAGSLAVAQPYQ